MRLARLWITSHRRHPGPESATSSRRMRRRRCCEPLGHAVEVVGYDLAELRGPVDVALVEAGEHLEIGRHAIKRLRQRPELVATRILLCIEVGRSSGLDPEMGADDFILMPVSPDELSARLASCTRATSVPARRCRSATATSSSTARCGRPTCAARRSVSRPTSSSCCGSSPIASAACSRGRSSCRASGGIATSGASAPSTPHVLNLRAKLGEPRRPAAVGARHGLQVAARRRAGRERLRDPNRRLSAPSTGSPRGRRRRAGPRAGPGRARRPWRR